jgi:hypothetical protein
MEIAILESSKRKYFCIQKIVVARKKHLARQQRDGKFKCLCGRRFGPLQIVAVETKYVQPEICKGCIRCRSKIIRRGDFPERLIRVFDSEEAERRYWRGKLPLGATEEGRALIAQWKARSKS